jgi:hypothetical protein
LKKLEGTGPELERRRAVAHMHLEQAVNEVLKVEMPTARLLEEATKLQAELVSKRLLLRELHRDLISDEELRKAVSDLLRANVLPGRWDAVTYDEQRAAWERNATTVAWRELREALTLDADAEVKL